MIGAVFVLVWFVFVAASISTPTLFALLWSLKRTTILALSLLTRLSSLSLRRHCVPAGTTLLSGAFFSTTSSAGAGVHSHRPERRKRKKKKSASVAVIGTNAQAGRRETGVVVDALFTLSHACAVLCFPWSGLVAHCAC